MRLPFFNRPSTKNNTPVEDGLTEDPERQRARHRLIGAIFLVTVAVAGLPIIFDSKPKQYNNDIAIQIIQPGSKNEKASDEKSEKKVEEPKKETVKSAKSQKLELIKTEAPQAKSVAKSKPSPSLKSSEKAVVTSVKSKESSAVPNYDHPGFEDV